VRWESDGGGEFTLEAVTARAAAVTLALREGEDDCLSRRRGVEADPELTDQIGVLRLARR